MSKEEYSVGGARGGPRTAQCFALWEPRVPFVEVGGGYSREAVQRSDRRVRNQYACSKQKVQIGGSAAAHSSWNVVQSHKGFAGQHIQKTTATNFFDTHSVAEPPQQPNTQLKQTAE